MAEYLDKTGLTYLWSKIKAKFDAKADKTALDAKADKKDTYALGKRIDNLILSSGTESSAEVVDARTGYDGTAYPTLGTAIRKQVSELKGDLDGISNKTLLFDIPYSIESGAIDITRDRWVEYETSTFFSVKKGEVYGIKTNSIGASNIYFVEKMQYSIEEEVKYYSKKFIPQNSTSFVTAPEDCYLYVYTGKNKSSKVIDWIRSSDNDPLKYGAVYDGVTDCTDAINIALSKGGNIHFKGNGTALCSGPLLISKSNTHIHIDGGFTIKLKDNSNHQLIKTPSCDYDANDPDQFWHTPCYTASYYHAPLNTNGNFSIRSETMSPCTPFSSATRSPARP